MTSLAFLSEIVQKTGTESSETMQIKRNMVKCVSALSLGYGEGQKEAALSMQVEGEKKQDIEIRVSPKIYSEKRLEKEFQKARKELAKVISGENKDLSHIKTDLDLVTALDDFPFSVSWELSRYDVMDSLGRLDQEKIRNMPGITVYIMKPGDTLWNIAKKFYTTVEEIMQMNDLDGDEVSSGTPLLLVKKVEE